MTVEAALWRRFPVRGAGRFVLRRLERRAERQTVVADGPCGTRLAVDPRCDPEVSVYLWGTYAPEVVAALERVSAPHQTSVDVGASCGVLSVVMGRLNVGGRVLAIDPAVASPARIGEQAELNELKIETVSCAVGDSPDASLDRVLADHAVDHLGVIKVQTGGSEPSVLRGSRATLERFRPTLIFRHSPEGWARHGESVAPIAGLLKECDYEIFEAVMQHRPMWSVAPVALDRFVPASLVAMAAGQLAAGNIVAIPAGSAGAAVRARLLA